MVNAKLSWTQSVSSTVSMGRNFATTQTVSKTVLLEVEKGIERFDYAKRRKDKISKCRENNLLHAAERSETSPFEDTVPVQATAEEDTAGEPAERRNRNGGFTAQDGEPAERRDGSTQDAPGGTADSRNGTTQDAPGETDDRDGRGEGRRRGVSRIYPLDSRI